MFSGLLNAEPILVKEQQWYYLTHSSGNKGDNIFPKSIKPKVNVIPLIWILPASWKRIIRKIMERFYNVNPTGLWFV